jgi:transposase, IS30 family
VTIDRPPDETSARPGCYVDTKLEVRERFVIADGVRTGRSKRSIATELGRNALVDRSTRFTILVHFVGTHDAEQLRHWTTAMFNRLPVGLRRSLTWDQGIETARHHE